MPTEKILTPEFRVIYPDIFKKVAYHKASEKYVNEEEALSLGIEDTLRYSINMIWDKSTDLSNLFGIIKQAAHEKWGSNLPANLHNPIRPGTEITDKEGNYKPGFGPEVVFTKASTKLSIWIVNANNDKIINPDELYSGCYAWANVTAWAYSVGNNQGVSLNLHSLQKTKDGERIITGVDNSNDFKPLASQNPANYSGADPFGSQNQGSQNQVNQNQVNQNDPFGNDAGTKNPSTGEVDPFKIF